MSAEVKKEIQLEIAHVLFTDIVGYSKLPVNEQRALIEHLNEIVRCTDEFQAAEAAGRLIKIRRLTNLIVPSRRIAFKRTVTLSRVEPTIEAISR